MEQGKQVHSFKFVYFKDFKIYKYFPARKTSLSVRYEGRCSQVLKMFCHDKLLLAAVACVL